MSKVRYPFRLTLHDDKAREIKSPPVWLWVEVPAGLSGWEWLSSVEQEALKDMLANAQCSLDWDEYKAQQTIFHPGENAGSTTPK